MPHIDCGDVVLASDYDAMDSAATALGTHVQLLEAREATWNARHERETKLADIAWAKVRELEEIDRQWGKTSLVAIIADRDRLREALEGALKLCANCDGNGGFEAYEEMPYVACSDCAPYRLALQPPSGEK